MKHPVLENRTRLIIWWLAWLILALGQTLLYFFAYGSFIMISIPDTLLSLLIFSVLMLSLWYPFSFFNKEKAKSLSITLNLIAGGVVTISLYIVITKSLMLLMTPDKILYNDYWTTTLVYRIGSGVFIYLLAILSYYLFISLTNLAEKKAREAKLESLVKETELRMLRSQINPHFLFNSLNSISSLTLTNPEKARDMVVKLSEFMRYALSKKDEQPVSLRSELENLRLYFDIEKIRFGDKLSTEEIIDSRCLEVKQPVMILQPLYENAIKHGVYESIQTVTIRTEVKLSDDYIVIIISNNFEPGPSSRKGSGTGLMNVERRLHLFYGNKGSITTSKDKGIFKVTLFIPAGS